MGGPDRGRRCSGPGSRSPPTCCGRWRRYIYLFGLAPLVSVGVNYLGEARRRIPVAIAALVVNFVVSIVLLNEIGVVGSAIGADAAYLIYVPAHFWICKQLIGLPVRPIAATFARTAIAAGAMAAVMIGFGTEDLTVLDWLAGSASGLATYCVVPAAHRRGAPHRAAVDPARPGAPCRVATVLPVRLIHLAGYGGPYPGSFIPMLRAVMGAAERRGWSREAVFTPISRERVWLGELDEDGFPTASHRRAPRAAS